MAPIAARQSLSVEVGYDEQCGVLSKEKLFHVLSRAGMLVVVSEVCIFASSTCCVPRRRYNVKEENQILATQMWSPWETKGKGMVAVIRATVYKSRVSSRYSSELCFSDTGAFVCSLFRSRFVRKLHMLQ